MIDTSPWSSCSRWSPRSPCFGRKISSTGPSVSPFRDFYILLEIYPKRNMEFILFRTDLACRCKFCQHIQGRDLASKEIEFSFKFTSTFIQSKHITPCDIYFPIAYINRISSEPNRAIRENWMTNPHLLHPSLVLFVPIFVLGLLLPLSLSVGVSQGNRLIRFPGLVDLPLSLSFQPGSRSHISVLLLGACHISLSRRSWESI